MKCTVTYTNGQPARSGFDSIQQAAAALLAEYPEGVIYDAGGFACDEESADSSYDIRSGRAGLAWASEEDSANDDGAKAVAAIEVS